jgi:hypothetical protein
MTSIIETRHVMSSDIGLLFESQLDDQKGCEVQIANERAKQSATMCHLEFVASHTLVNLVTHFRQKHL